MGGSELVVRRLGLMGYRKALAMQVAAAEALRRGPDSAETVFALQHKPVITIGRSGDRGHIRLDDAELGRFGLEVVQTDRGGDVTVHSPGQVVLYPVLHLGRRRLGPARLVELLEEAMIDTCRSFGVAASRLPPHPGIWVSRGRASGLPSKIGAIGLRISGYVTTHGIALNVSNDLSLFEAIVPCGLPGMGVTSISVEAGHDVDTTAVEDALVWAVRTELSDASRDVPVAGPADQPRRSEAERR